jgi:hypothetical protein
MFLFFYPNYAWFIVSNMSAYSGNIINEGGGQPMLKRLSSGLSILVLMIVFAAVAGSAHAQVTDCTGNLAPGNYVALNVPAGATCTINTGTVNVTTGGVTVGAGASFFVASPVASLVITSGSLNSTSARFIEVTAQIHGSVNVDGTTGGAVLISDSFIGGTLAVTNSSVVGLGLARNTIGGSLIDQNNQCFNEGGCNSVVSNTIGGNLICMGNTPPPVTGGTSNTVAGNLVGQCAPTP